MVIDRALDDVLSGRATVAAESVNVVAGLADRHSFDAATLGRLAEAEFYLDRYADALRHFDRALRQARPEQAATLLLGKCRTNITLGRLAEAEQDAVLAEKEAGPLLPQARTIRALAMLWRYGPADAVEVAQLGLRDCAGPTAVQTAQMVVAHIQFGKRRYHEALQLLDETPQGWRHANWFSGIAECYAALGDGDAAASWGQQDSLGPRRRGSRHNLRGLAWPAPALCWRLRTTARPCHRRLPPPTSSMCPGADYGLQWLI